MLVNENTALGAQFDAALLPGNAGETLLPLARSAIAAQLGISPTLQHDAAWLRINGASFVTLLLADQLRGCIGTLEAHRPLDADVRENAVAAAFRDPRFPALSKTEFETLNVEVSVLTPPSKLAFRDEADALAQLRPGVDGVILEYGHHRSTFLPQVWEDLTDPQLFMSHLKRKAGLPPDFWDATVTLARYAVTKWRESDRAR